MTNNEGLAWLEQQADDYERKARALRETITVLRGQAEAFTEPRPRRTPRAAGGGITDVVLRTVQNTAIPLRTSGEVWEAIQRGGVTINTSSSDPGKMVASTLRQLARRGAIVNDPARGWMPAANGTQ